jgi:hypothetical protein
MGKTLQRLVASHAVPAGSQEVIVAFNFISDSTVQFFDQEKSNGNLKFPIGNATKRVAATT